MKSRLLRALLPAALLGLLAFAMPAAAGHNADFHSPNMIHVANLKKAAVNSDLAFWGKLAFAGNYGGFRIIDISNPAKPVQLVDFLCNGPQNDVSVYQAKKRLLLFQSIDRAQTKPTCDSANSTAAQGGFEGIRVFDVTKPAQPKLIAAVQTDCGSHTHTTIPDPTNHRAIIYVSSYPLSPNDLGPNCVQPHQKISIVEVTDRAPEKARVLKEQPLHADTQVFGDGIQACHDISAFIDSKVEVAAAACLSEGQLWDISDPANPCTVDPACHTHVDNTLVEIWHSATFTWDSKIVLYGDEHGGGSAHGCNGSEDPTGNIWFYKNATPGSPLGLLGRYQIPRPQPADDSCTLHNFNIVPIQDNARYLGVSSSYEGGTTVFEFTPLKTVVDLPLDPIEPAAAPLVAEEFAFYDAQNGDGNGYDDAWSSYWYNDFIYVNGGLGNRTIPAAGDRGFDIFKLLNASGKQITARSFHHLNPQTQESFATGG